MKRLIILGIFSIFSLGCGLMDDYSARGLKNYFIDAIKPHNIKIEEIACAISPSGSRTGYFLFKIDSGNFVSLITALKLEKKELFDPVKKEAIGNQELFFFLSRAKDIANFPCQNPLFKINDLDTWNETPFAAGIDVYIANPPLAPFSGNTRSSFDFLIYNSSTNQACAFLQYPYG